MAYIVFIFGYGFLCSKKQGANKPPSLFIATASLCAAFIGGGFSLGNAQSGFSAGISGGILLLGFSFGQLLSAFLFAPLFSSFPNAHTVGDIIKISFGETAKRFSGLLSVVFCIGILGAQINAFGSVAAYLFGFDRVICSLVGFSGIIAFAALGGIRASQKSDALQVTALFIGLSLAFILSFQRVGGLSGLAALSPPLFFALPPFSAKEFISPFCTFMLGELLCPPSVSRLLLSQNKLIAKRSSALSALLSAPFFIVTSLIGILSRALSFTAQAEYAMPSLINEALVFPLNAVFFGAMLSVYLSSGCAFLLSCSDALYFDLLLKNQTEQPRDLVFFRLSAVVCGGLALILSLAFNGVLSILILAYCFWCPIMLVPLILSLKKKRYSKRVFFLACGASVTVLLTWKALGEPFGISAILAGLTASFAAFILSKEVP